VAEPSGSTPVIAKPVIGHGPKPVPTASHRHSIIIYLRSILMLSFHLLSVLQAAVLQALIKITPKRKIFKE
jgi:hypothetical protein